MKKLIFFIFLFILSGCSNPIEDSKDVVNSFLISVNSSKAIDESIVTDEYMKLLGDRKYYVIDNWLLEVDESQNFHDISIPEPSFVVTAKGVSKNGFGMDLSVTQLFNTIIDDGKIRIINSKDFIAFDDLAFTIKDPAWENYWDSDKLEIIEFVKNNIKLSIIKEAYFEKYSDSTIHGRLKIENNSSYEISDIAIEIDHYDDEDKSVNSETEYVYDSIKPKGYREFDWITLDCNKCKRQEYEIKFVK